MLIFVLDSTKDRLLYNTIIKSKPAENVFFVNDIDAAMSNVLKKQYHLIVMSRVSGKHDVYDLAEQIKYGHLIKRAEIIFVEDSPTVSEKVRGILRGRRFYKYGFDELEEVEKLVERMG